MSDESAKKFKIVTLGCRTNQYESQAYQDQLLAMGYSQAVENDAADICIVNTCTVTESADSSSRHEIRKLARENPESKLVVTGCYAERQPDKLKQIGGVSHVVANKDKEKLLSIALEDDGTSIPEFSIKRFEAHTRAFVKVQDGCNSFCTYCIIPYVRGRSRSRSMSDVVKEVEELIRNGYKEVVLTGINIGDFDGNKEESPDRLADLIRVVDNIPGLERLRVSSIDPDEVDDDLADAIINGKKTCKSMHVVLQSGSNVILKRMNRKYTRQIFFDTVDRLVKASPDFTFTTDIIVGFPGETEADFEETLDAMRKVRFAKVHMFPYSDRPRTRSALMPNKVPSDIIKMRKQQVMHLAEQLAFNLRNDYLGRRMTILTENNESGHTDNFLNVVVKEGIKPNELLEVELYENTPVGLLGRIRT